MQKYEKNEEKINKETYSEPKFKRLIILKTKKAIA